MEPVTSEVFGAGWYEADGRVGGGGNGAAAWCACGSGWLSTRATGAEERTEPVTSLVAGALLEAKGLEKGVLKRLMSELHPAALNPISVRAATRGHEYERDNATTVGMGYSLRRSTKT
jgi:hypothetical protein